jgi:peptide/nickel transport system substrate-binding protein
MRGFPSCLSLSKGFIPLLAALSLAVTSPVISVEPACGGTLKLITQNDLKVLDPFWTTAYISRNHGYMIYDVLLALDDKLIVQPQMIDSWEVSQDRLRHTFILRDGLQWHDGQSVTSADVIASLKRWGDTAGQPGKAADTSD